jgi:hypothetical protein
MSEYLDEALWRENYRDLVGGVRMVREAVEESFGLIAPLPHPGRIGSSVKDCDHIAQAIVVYAERMRRRIAELEEQVALTSRVDIEGVTETKDAPPGSLRVRLLVGPCRLAGFEKPLSGFADNAIEIVEIR